MSHMREQFSSGIDIAADPHAASLRQTQARLEEADQIARDMRLVARIPEADRPRLARNLGRMVEAARADDVHKLIGQLFRETFGVEGATSALKKRRRYLRLSGEPLPPADAPGEYHARGAEFVRLAHALSLVQRSPTPSPDDARHQAILNLVEGTGFDMRARATLKRKEAGRFEFIEQMERMLARIESSVDLYHYFEAASDIPLDPVSIHKLRNLSASGAKAGMDQLQLTTATSEGIAEWEHFSETCNWNFCVGDSSEWRTLRIKPQVWRFDTEPTGEDGDKLGILGTSFLAPKVLIGLVYTPVAIGECIPYQTSDPSHTPTHDEELLNALTKMYGPENVSHYRDVMQWFRREIDELLESHDNSDASVARLARLEEMMRHRLEDILGLERIDPELSPDEDIEQIRQALTSMYGSEAMRTIDEIDDNLAATLLPDVPSDVREDRRRMLWRKLATSSERVVWVGHSVFLSIYRERATGRARLAVTVSTREVSLDYSKVVKRFPLDVNDANFEPRHFSPTRLRGKVWLFTDTASEGYLFYDLDTLVETSKIALAERLHFLQGDAAMSLLFMPMDRNTWYHDKPVFKPLFDDCPNSFSPAPSQTIAGAILRNLAHAAPGSRLDELLLADAMHKADALRQLLEREEQGYRSGVERLKG